MIGAQVRLSLRLARFELLAFCGLAVIVALYTVFVAGRIEELAPPAACFEEQTGVWDEAVEAARQRMCGDAMDRFYQAQAAAGPAPVLLIFLPFAGAIFLGVPIVARELERGTARLAWSLTTSRRRWFILRVLPTLALLAISAFIAGVALDRFWGAVRPELEMANAFDYFGLRGGLIASRALFIFGIAVLVGVVVGRALPGIIVAAIIATIAISGGQNVHERILDSEAIVVDGEQYQPGSHYVSQGWRLPDGRIVRYEELGEEPYDEEGNPKFPVVQFLVPGTQYRFAETREALVLAAGTLVGLAAAGFAVTRRRPT